MILKYEKYKNKYKMPRFSFKLWWRGKTGGLKAFEDTQDTIFGSVSNPVLSISKHVSWAKRQH